MLLEKINEPNDIKKLSPDELPVLAKEIRTFLLKTLSVTGGHVASNLGDVELTIALHRVLDFPSDKLIWDVGHQSYTHKILTGRRDQFASLRQYGGISGFMNPDESSCDPFISGHSSTSIAVASGLAQARQLKGGRENVVAVIGDGALTGGLAYEALNNVSRLKSNLTIILNDNHMSISENVGGMSTHLSSLRTSSGYKGLKNDIEESLRKIPGGEQAIKRIRRTKNGIKQLLIPGMIFENMGIMYLGPVDGHDIGSMIRLIRQALTVEGPVIVHAVTRKGKGYLPAEKNPSLFHGIGPFDLATGKPLQKKEKPDYTDIFSRTLVGEAERDKRIVAVTAAMGIGTGLRRFRRDFPDRYFDVGIAEGYGTTFTAGLAAGGMLPVFAVYSSFLQRGFDQLIHDVAIGGYHCVFAVDRAGIVGRDGITHQGIFDLSYLTMVPGVTVMAPKDGRELKRMLTFAIREMNSPVAIRYPRGEAADLSEESLFGDGEPIEYARAEIIKKKSSDRVLLFAIGSMVGTAIEAEAILNDAGIPVSVVNARFAAPLDKDFLTRECDGYDLIVSMEENVRSGGFGEKVLSVLAQSGYRGDFLNISIPDEFVPHGSCEELKRETGLDASSVAAAIIKRIEDQKIRGGSR
ncbi:1-deoxy-D-xylulose-5-phosphate synthase [Candidatus Weimeria sp. HCP3S3_B5]|uniref:1-deoxy-D-xylulose-5-phosphate synthase n=1 Tax=Candidatus Weimeria sp. HCP3S3_B5 TaxID=3438871 RepID=UPI003F8B7632